MMKNGSLKESLEKRNRTKKNIVIVIILTILIAGCAPQSPTPQEDASIAENENINEESTSEKAVKNEGKNTATNEATKKETAKEIQPQKTQQGIKTQTTLIYDTAPPKQDGSTLRYGALCITLPDGVFIEEQTPEQNMYVLDLVGAENLKDPQDIPAPFPPRLWIAHYRGDYENDLDLTSALLDILPDTVLMLRHKDAAARRYLFTYDDFPYQNGYAVVYKNDIYLIKEHSAERYFYGLLDEDAVRWEDGTIEIGGTYLQKNNTVYEKVKADETVTFLVMQFEENDTARTVFLYRDGQFNSPESIFSFPESAIQVEFKDCNFDGCPDMIMPAPIGIYLWNAEKKAYEATELPEGFPQHFYQARCYAETKTIYGYQYNEEQKPADPWDPYMRTETLWQWEGTLLVLKRKCTAEPCDEEIRIWAYDYTDNAETLLFDKTVFRSEWEQNNDSVQACYQTFYAGLLSEINDDWLHPVTYSQNRREYIPQAFLDKIADAMRSHTVPEFLQKNMVDKVLTRQEAIDVSKDCLELRGCLLGEEQIEYYMVWADVDNDGIEDILTKEYYHNADQFTDYGIYQGQKDGTYKKTDEYSFAGEEFYVLSYDGNNYVCRVPYGYRSKDGMSLACYVEGIAVETVRLFFSAQEYDIQIAECAQEQYKALAEGMLNNSLDYKNRIDAYKSIDGSSEEKGVSAEYDFQCDLNNDGLAEQYDKANWWDNPYIDTEMQEAFRIYGRGAGIEPVCNALDMAEGDVLRLWVEPFAGKNIVHIFSKTQAKGFEIAGFLLNGAECERIYRITADVTYGVRQERENIVRKMDKY